MSRDCCSLFLILSKNSTYCTYEPAKKYCLHDVRGMLASLKWCPYSRSVVDLAYSTSTCSINYFTFEKSKLNDKSNTYADTVSTYSHWWLHKVPCVCGTVLCRSQRLHRHCGNMVSMQTPCPCSQWVHGHDKDYMETDWPLKEQSGKTIRKQ